MRQREEDDWDQLRVENMKEQRDKEKSDSSRRRKKKVEINGDKNRGIEKII